MSPVFACRVPASDTRITRSLNLGTLALIALCACTPIRAGDVVTTAASPLAQPKSLRQVGLPATAIQAAIPADNPQTPEKIALGQRLFFDARLSADGTVACSTCHDPTRAFTDGKPVSTGIEGRVGERNAPTILDAQFETTQFWDGPVATLEQQAALPSRPQRDTVRAFGPQPARSKPPNTTAGCGVPRRSQTVASVTEC